jgi:toxin ParE1/3/4
MPESRRDIRNLRNLILSMSKSQRIAANYIARLGAFVEGLSLAPYRGEARFGSKTGIRTIGFERSISVVFRIVEERQAVEIVGIYDHGRNPEFAQQRDI